MIQRLQLIFYAAVCFAFSVKGQTPNYDEAKVVNYELPDPLIDGKGNRVTSKEHWLNSRRPEILNLFKAHVYGKFPSATGGLNFKVTSVDTKALGGKATRKEITIYFTSSKDAPSMDVLLYTPNGLDKSVPVAIGLNFSGNHTTHREKGIKISDRWMRENEQHYIKSNKGVEESRGLEASAWPIDSLIAHGYGVATAYYEDLEPDHDQGWRSGIRATLKDELKIKPEDWGAIGAWAWGLCRIMDYLQTDKDVNTNQVVVTGHSRLGKAALWAAANDERFAVVVSNNTGEGGAALARRNFGETVERINTSFPHWFINQYKQYNSNVNLLPVDQHMLLALIAPRPLYVASAEDDHWADPKGEFISLVHASPVYALFGKNGLSATDSPQLNKPISRDVAYRIRPGKHAITLDDWMQFVKFANMHFSGK